ncbi:uncharacterized protein I206_100184 [Kwoniella pini CBS 10737]|uniref:Cupin type-2 domain-containing protein n=1 Tax=Kwoniella pini CBS 10737 TaxID=1296096 RepID=A0A1B9IEI0_9TREE|nr:uncharacterized protein I206_01141 [Kwoniella pini CBS 10737]OCF53834.1 hypothetical protein I206_01141 [Kwoniella pini CBS 10737]
MSSEIQSNITVVKGSSLVTSGGQTEGMERRNALIDLSKQLNGSLMIAKPHTSSGIHHHSNQDTIIYSVKGKGAIISNGGKLKRELNPGDWCLVPAGEEHQEANIGEEEVIWVIVRGNGGEPQVVNVDDWSENRS